MVADSLKSGSEWCEEDLNLFGISMVDMSDLKIQLNNKQLTFSDLEPSARLLHFLLVELMVFSCEKQH